MPAKSSSSTSKKPAKETQRAKVICLAQYKGGTGKTSSVLNIGAVLRQQGYRVLVVDMDVQASLTIWLGVDPSTLKNSMKALLTTSIPAEEVIVETAEGLDLLPSNLDLALIEYKMPALNRELVLSRKLEPLKARYDFILIDTTPSLIITTVNAMVAADYLLIPVQPEPLCLFGLAQLSETFELIRTDMMTELNVLGLFITLYDSRIGLQGAIVEKIKEAWGDLVFHTMIPRRAALLDATLSNQSIVTASKNTDIARQYRALTEEILQRVQQQ